MIIEELKMAALQEQEGDAVIIHCGEGIWKSILQEVGECNMYSDRTGEFIVTYVPGLQGESDDVQMEYWDMRQYTKEVLAILGE